MVDFDGLKAKAENLAAQAKEVATDDKIDAVAAKLKDVAPDSIDSKIDAVADKAKGLNN